MTDSHQDAADENTAAVPPITVGNIPADQRSQVDQSGIASVNIGRVLSAHHERFGEEQYEDGAHAVVAETLPHLRDEEDVQPFRMAFFSCGLTHKRLVCWSQCNEILHEANPQEPRASFVTIFENMKRIMLVALPLFLSLAVGVSAQTYQVFKGDTINRTDKKGLKQGVWKKYYRTDTLFSVCTFKDDKRIGSFLTYSPNGKLQTRLVYRGTTGISDAQLFDESGAVIGKGKYIGQERDSVWTFFDEKGVLTSRESYLKGKKNGLTVDFYPDGKPARSANYLAGQLDGPYVEYFATGKTKVEGKMEAGDYEGTLRIFHPNGKVWQEGQYVNGLREGVWVTFDETGLEVSRETFKNGNSLDPKFESDSPIEVETEK